jgi:EAL domain-containing protein (putative c-di-GMP-specific phosphodiesterase class I)
MAAQVFALRRRIATAVPTDFRIALNIGVRDQAVPVIIDRLIAQAARSGVSPAGITLEITETAVISDTGSAAKAVATARQHGFAVALDDFGTGYSSLSLLRDLELDEVKIDRSFVARMAASPADAAVVAGVLDLARRLDLMVVAEGVETEDEVQRLIADGAVYGQGYFYSPAVPPERFETMLAENLATTGGSVVTN